MSAEPPKSAQLEWQDGVPVSTDYGDVYFSRENGLAETRHVFLSGNQLAERFVDHTQPVFTIAETGFGTGLNFLAAWQLWASLPEPKPCLHYITLDLHPLSPLDLEKAHAVWPELSAFSEAMRAVYPPLFPGMHRRVMDAEGRVTVDFLWGEAQAMLVGYAPAFCTPKVDAWFLDGFSPAKNPHMWQPELYTQIARLSASGTTLATFTAAGHVKRGLQDVGFAMEKIPGHGRKREMLCGRFRPESRTAPKPVQKSAMVIGAGIAGVGAAWQLTQMGYHVDIFDSASGICHQASGNPAAAFTPYFTADWSARGRLYASGFSQTRHLWQWLQTRGHTIKGELYGSLVLGDPALAKQRQQARHARLELPCEVMEPVSAEQASVLAGLALPYGGYHYPQGGWLNMHSLCTALLAEMRAHVSFHASQPIDRIAYENGQWSIYDPANTQLGSAEKLVLACGYQAQKLLPELPLQAVRGQLLKLSGVALQPLAALGKILHFGEYLTPLNDGAMILGSSFSRNDMGLDIRAEDSAMLLQKLRDIFPALDTSGLHVEPWVNVRVATAQRMPLIGPVANQPEGLYCSLAHGSRGSLSGLYPFISR